METFNQRQLGKLEAFDHLLNTIGVYETQTNTGMKYVGWWENEQGKRYEQTVYHINQKLIGVLSRIGFNMYLNFLEESIEMKEEADNLLGIHNGFKDMEREDEIDKIKVIWEAS